MPLHPAFAGQIHLDIHHLLREDTDAAFDSMFEQITRMGETALAQVKLPGKELKSTFCRLQGTVRWISEDPLLAVRREVFPTCVFEADVHRHRLLRPSPVLSGLMLYQVRMSVFDHGVSLADMRGSILYT